MLLKMFQNYEDSVAVIFEPSLHGFSNTSQHTVINVASTNARKILLLCRERKTFFKKIRKAVTFSGHKLI